MISLPLSVIPAKAGTQSGWLCAFGPWVPAFAGMTVRSVGMTIRGSGNDGGDRYIQLAGLPAR